MKKKKSGQAMVEYLLILGVIVGVIAIVKDGMIGQRSVATLVLRSVSCQVDTEKNCMGPNKARMGGRPTYGSYYTNKKTSGSIKLKTD